MTSDDFSFEGDLKGNGEVGSFKSALFCPSLFQIFIEVANNPKWVPTWENSHTFIFTCLKLANRTYRVFFIFIFKKKYSLFIKLFLKMNDETFIILPTILYHRIVILDLFFFSWSLWYILFIPDLYIHPSCCKFYIYCHLVNLNFTTLHILNYDNLWTILL